jgi:hypothetical protein
VEEGFQLMAPAGLSEVCWVIAYCEDNPLRSGFFGTQLRYAQEQILRASLHKVKSRRFDVVARRHVWS